jgi:hypothetical protein
LNDVQQSFSRELSTAGKDALVGNPECAAAVANDPEPPTAQACDSLDVVLVVLQRSMIALLHVGQDHRLNNVNQSSVDNVLKKKKIKKEKEDIGREEHEWLKRMCFMGDRVLIAKENDAILPNTCLDATQCG